MNNDTFTISKYRTAIFLVLALLVLYFISRYNYLLFHSLVDGVSIVIAACIFTIIWNGRRIVDNDYFLCVGIAFLFFALWDLLHLLGNKNMGVFPEYGNLGPALYIVSRYILSVSLMIAPLFINRKLSTALMVAVYSLVTLFILLSIFYWHTFPVCIVDGVGLTPLKVVSDYIICLILLGSIGLLLINRKAFDPRVLWLIVSSLILSIATGLAFTLYVDPFGIMNAVGHFFQIASFFLIYLSFIETSLTKPQDILYQKLKKNEGKLAENVEQLNNANAVLEQEVTERKRVEKTLRESESRYALTLDALNDGLWDWNVVSGIAFFSPRYYSMLGYDDSEFPANYASWRTLVHPEDLDRVEEELRLSIESGRSFAIDLRMKLRLGGWRWVSTRGKVVENNAEGKALRVVGTLIDINERKQAEAWDKIRSEVLAILNEPGGGPDLIHRILAILKSRTGCDAVAIRLQEGEDFPYIAQDGFPAEFLRTENTLISNDAGGLVCRDKDGNVRLECTCGLVIAGYNDDSSPFFTKGGSFWTNDSFLLLDLPSNQEPRHNPRNHCIHLGYASIALVPIRNKERIVGLIQFNNQQKGYLTLATVKRMEEIAAHIGEAMVRRWAEEALRESNELLSIYLQHSPIYTFIKEVTPTGSIVLKASDNFAQMIGVAASEMVGKTADELFPPELAAKITANDRTVVLSGDALTTDEEVNGRSYTTIKFPIVQRSKTLLAGYSIDITERKRAEDELIQHRNRLEDLVKERTVELEAANISLLAEITERKQAEEALVERTHELATESLRLQTLLETASDAIHILDEEGNLVQFSESFLHMLGYDKDEAITLKVEDWDIKISKDQLVDTIRTLIKYPAAFETKHRRKDGTVLDVEINAKGIELDHIHYLYASARDITERKRIEGALDKVNRQLSSVLESAGDVIAMMDNEYRYTLFNTAFHDEFRRIFGVSLKQGDSMPEALANLPDDLTNAMAYWNRALGGEDFTVVQKFGDSTLMRNWYELHFSPIRDVSNNITGAVHVVREINERQKNEQALVEARERADRANQAKSEFLANMSHEIRTPLNGVIGNAQLLEMSNLDDDQKEYVAAMILSGNNLLSLINNILDLSKIEAEMVVMEKAAFTLRGCINSVVLTQRSRIAKKGLSFKLHIPDDIPDILKGDALRVKQILINLLGNAVKFTSLGSITVSAALKEQEGNKVRIELAVTDTGIGMPTEVAAEIFKPFTQADGSITRRYGGSGLGLSICERLIKLMGGSISVESTEHIGSTFRISLPFEVVESVVQEQITPHVSATPLWTGAVLNVLLAEDDEINRQFAVKLLEKMGHAVTAVENGQEALDVLGRTPFDIVLMDIQMPVMDGLTAIAQLREREHSTGSPSMPVIALTAYALKGDKQKFLAAGFDGHVTKPVDIKNLIGEMQQVLDID